MKKLLFILFAFFISNVQGQNKIESSLEESFNGSTWQNSAGTNYSYDTAGNLTSSTRYNWNAPGWTASFRAIYTYNASNKVLSDTQQFWDSQTSQLVNNYKINYTYDGTGKLISNVEQEWISNAWVNAYKSDVSYNGNLVAGAISQKWLNNVWVNDFRYTATYTAGNLTQWLDEKWTGTAWINENRNVFSYNATNRKTANRLDVWNTNAWSENENTSYVLATNGNRTSEIFSQNGILRFKTDNTYDSAALMSSFTTPFKDKTGVDYFFEDFPHVNKILSSLNYNYQVTTSSYTLSGRTTYNYLNQIALNTKSVEVKNIKLYPNPATNFIEISGLTSSEKITIYNLLGEKVFEKSVNANEKVNIEYLASGLYLLNFENGSAIKFIKE